MRRLVISALTALVVALVLTSVAAAHPERPSRFPDWNGEVPKYRTDGRKLVVCKSSTERLIANFSGEARRRNRALLDNCRFEHIQQAVNAARNGDRILIMPGTYLEEPSRAVPTPDPRCKDDFTQSEGDPAPDLGSGPTPATEEAPTYGHHRKCPNSLNLIGIIGDRPDDGNRRCDDKCNLQIEGTGEKRTDVRIIGARHKDNVFRADRADGIHFRNFQVQFSDFNNIYVHETNGFHLDDILTRFSREYGALSFTSDNGLYENIEGYGTGDSAIYPGSGPQRKRCGEYGIEVRNVNSHHNTIGHSGTAGDSTWVHHSKFHHNAAGITTDSFASGHPGMPQDCSRFENNRIYSNNENYFSNKRDEYCRNTPPQKRNRTVVCPSFQVPVGTGLVIAGGNGNVVRKNHFWDNWRNGVRLFYVPSTARGEPEDERDTSHDNRFIDNRMGVRPDGQRSPNGYDPNPLNPFDHGDGYGDFWWDEEGFGNCWRGNRGPGGAEPTAFEFTLACPAPPAFPTGEGDPNKISSQASCASWDPQTNSDPPGCDWFNKPPEPK